MRPRFAHFSPTRSPHRPPNPVRSTLPYLVLFFPSPP
jgi:hypothetical protein